MKIQYAGCVHQIRSWWIQFQTVPAKDGPGKPNKLFTAVLTQILWLMYLFLHLHFFFSHQLTLWRSTLNKNAKWIKSHPSLTIWTKQRWTILTRDWDVQLQKLKTFNWNRSRMKTPEALPEISFVTLQIGPKV